MLRKLMGRKKWFGTFESNPGREETWVAQVYKRNKPSSCDCCDRANEYNGFSSGSLLFVCPKHCSCHD